MTAPRRRDRAGDAPPPIATILALALVALPLVMPLAACDTLLSPFESSKPERYYPLYSPNGEPLSGGPLGKPSCKDALGGWYDRVAASHGGTIDLETYLADTRRQFAAMDLDHDGLLNPAVLAQYRAPYALRPEPGARPGDPRSRRPEDAGLAGDRADPVMIADVTLRNQVSLDDFLAYQRRKFAELNTHHDGVLRREEVLAICEASR
ncbi:MAG: hypothetical protein JO255_11755 [Alphaproteobacteria bacterium]|nr:hypothetical protein [Alphaproteobacteria bacterium]